MKNSMAIILTIIFVITLTTVPVFAAETKNITGTPIILSVQNSDTENPPQIVHSYTKTVIKTYSSYPVPSSISFMEYDMNAWFSGTLYLQSVYRSGGNWIATCSGTLIGVI